MKRDSIAGVNFVVHVAVTFIILGSFGVLQLAQHVFSIRFGMGFILPTLFAEATVGGFAAALLVLELATGVALLWLRPGRLPRPLAYVSLALLALIWISIGVSLRLMMKELARLSDSAAELQALLYWLRIGLWSLRAAVVGWMLRRVAAP